MEITQIRRELETEVFRIANAANTPVCVKGTGDLVRRLPDFTEGDLVNGFSTDYAWARFSVNADSRNNIAIGGRLKRIYGTLDFTIYAPDGTAFNGGDMILELLYTQLQGVEFKGIHLRNVRLIGEITFNGWESKTYRIAFEHTVI